MECLVVAIQDDTLQHGQLRTRSRALDVYTSVISLGGLLPALLSKPGEASAKVM